MLDFTSLIETEPNTSTDTGDSAQPGPTSPTPDAATSEQDDFVHRVFGKNPAAYAADDMPPAAEATACTPAPATEAPSDDPEASAHPNDPYAEHPFGNPFQSDGEANPASGTDPETGGPLTPPDPADPAPVSYDPDMTPETGEPRMDPPDAEDPDADGGEYEPRDDPPKPPVSDDPDMNPETGEPWPDPPHAEEPDTNGTEREPDPDPEANTGRGSGPGEASPGGQPPVERLLLGMPQREQAADTMAKMSPEDHAQVQSLLELAAKHSPDEVEYVVKAIAAGHSAAELKEFQKTISGKDPAWLDANLRLVGGSSGKGIKQQWSHSCASTEVEAMKGELDPVYAYQLRQKNPKLDQADDTDGAKVNPDMAEEQFRLLNETGGIAKPRSQESEGRGGKMSTVLNSELGGMGLSFDRNEVGVDATMDQVLATAHDRLKSGLPVPICVGDDGNPFAHAAMMTAVDDGPPRRFSIHDPWTGSIKTYSEDDIRNGKLDVGSCKKLGAIYPPTRK